MKVLTRRTTTLLLALILLAAWRSLTFAQSQNAATLKGRILDDSGAGLPGVVVTLSNSATTIPARTCVTDLEGAFSFAEVPPVDGYSVKASIPGFATVIAGPLGLRAARTTTLDLVLKPSADLEETVRVEARGEIVSTSSTSTVTTYNAEFIEDLPLIGRKFNDILTLAPGVTDPDGDGNPNVRGARDTGLQLRLDGTNITNPLSGHFGQDINLESIEEVEIITAGATAEYGRADGGFANVITKSGGNELQGSLKVFYRSDFFDGDGGLPRDDDKPALDFSDTDIFLTLGGPLVRDHLWYFAAVESLDHEVPVVFSDSATGLRTETGWRAFGKVTWQASQRDKLAFQINYDPLEVEGNNIGPRVAPESDYLIRTGGPLVQISWTSVISPSLLLQTLVSHLDSSLETLPAASGFKPLGVQTEIDSGSLYVLLPCRTTSCSGEEPDLYEFSREPLSGPEAFLGKTGALIIEGPYYFQNHQSLQRSTLKSDLSWSVEEHLGSHAVKGGFEASNEQYTEQQVTNPILTDGTHAPYPGAAKIEYEGTLNVQVFDPHTASPGAEGFNFAGYLQESWKPIPNVAINVGARIDHEEIESKGFTSFDPRQEVRKTQANFDLWCAAAGDFCKQKSTPGRIDFALLPSTTPLRPGDPARKFDLDHDGVLELFGPEGDQILAPLTTQQERLNERFLITNTNLAPRFSMSWDPWSDGRTKLFGTWGKYYDRLFLGTVTTEQQADSYVATWIAQGVQSPAFIGSRSRPLPTPAVTSTNQTARDLATPNTIEWTAGIERELAPEWAITLTYVSRRGNDLLQDEDLNHITCSQFDTIFGVDPHQICGDGGRLERDRFGKLDVLDETVTNLPNGAPDLYVLNRHFNQVLRVDNSNASQFTSTELMLRRRLHRNWQMFFSYTYSKAHGDAESFVSSSGNDPAVSDRAAGYLDFDQRHVLKWQGTALLPHDIVLGSTVQWASGTPYTIVGLVTDLDDLGNVTQNRIFSATGEKNDQRNNGQWTINARIEKSLTVGGSQISAFLEGENLLNADDLQLLQVDRQAGDVLSGTRRFGRRWQIGAAVKF